MGSIKINKIQKSLMIKAGFELHPAYLHVENIAYWRRGDVIIVWSRKDCPTLEKLVDNVINQASYKAVRAERDRSKPSCDEIQFKYKNT
jgi:hypothetical protein